MATTDGTFDLDVFDPAIFDTHEPSVAAIELDSSGLQIVTIRDLEGE